VTHRIWLTGLGLVTPLGMGVEASWARLVRGDCAIRPVRLFDARGYRSEVAAEVPDVAPPRGDSPWEWSRSSSMAVAAAAEAMHAAGVDAKRSRVGLVVGGTTGGMFENEELLARLGEGPHPSVPPRSMLSHPLTATGDRLSEVVGPFARIRTVSSACSSGANALIVAALWLQGALEEDAALDAVVAGGSDGLCRLTFGGFNALGALDAGPCRPFDRRRQGTSLGEGAGFVVLERAERARARGAHPVAQLAGWASGSEAHHITNPAPDGATIVSLVATALDRAGMTPSDVDYVSAHGTGTKLNDPIEAAALARALGADVDRIAVSSCKGQIGHTLGAAGAIEAVVTALVVARRTLVPTAGLDEPDPDIRLVHVPHVGRVVPRVRAAISNAFGFGGMDSVLVFAEPEFAPKRASWCDARPARPAGQGSGDAAGAGVGAAGDLRVGEPLRVPCVVTGAAVFGSCGVLGTDQCATLGEQAFDVTAPAEPELHLDRERARRLDRASRLAAVAVGRATRDAGTPAARTGIILGRAFGNVDGSAAFMHRMFDRGPRAANPAEFPNLVPSAPVGHVSIYLGLHGPSFMTAALSTSGESAIVQAVELVTAGEGPTLVAGAVEARSSIVEDVLAGLFASGMSDRLGHPELAAAVVLESRSEAALRGARALASVDQWLEWRRGGACTMATVTPPRGPRSEVIAARESETLVASLAATPWGSCARLVLAPVVGESDALGAVAIAAAVGRLAVGKIDEALVVGSHCEGGYAFVLRRT
jgi:3-oxoacyl-[acyl-carrier-protein] synthase II